MISLKKYFTKNISFQRKTFLKNSSRKKQFFLQLPKGIYCENIVPHIQKNTSEFFMKKQHLQKIAHFSPLSLPLLS